MLEGADPGGPSQTITLRESMKIIPRNGGSGPLAGISPACVHVLIRSPFLSLSLSLSLSFTHRVSPAAIQRARVPIAKIVERSSFFRGSGVSFTCSKFQQCNFTAIVHAIVPLVSAIGHYVVTCRGYFYYYINYTSRPRSQG